jgi:2-dehydro-3-deoxyphosphogluconate aldolase/(4S)-4-hydroxy-2-oxoglutarate aldolase
MNTKDILLKHKIVAIIRGADPAKLPYVADALYAGGIRALEITMNSEGALDQIQRLAKKGGELLVGAGTVTDRTEALAALEAGAQFIISPNTDIEVIRLARSRGAVSIPGAYTATEIVAAWKAGADIIKVFPAASPQYIRDVRGPLNHIPLMPTGGVSLENIAAFQKAGAVAFGIGSALVDSREQLSDDWLKKLEQRAILFVNALRDAQ